MPELASAIAHYQDLLTEYFDSTVEGLRDATERHGLQYDGRHYAQTIQPFILPRSMAERHAKAAVLVTQAIRRVARLLVTHEELRRHIEFPEGLEMFVAMAKKQSPAALFAGRIDGFFDLGEPREPIRFIEYNPVPGGVGSIAQLTRSFNNLPIARRFFEKYPCRTTDVAECAAQAFSRDVEEAGVEGSPRFVICSQRPGWNTTANESFRWVEVARRRGASVSKVEAEKLRVRDGRVWIEEGPVDLLWIDYEVMMTRGAALKDVFGVVAEGGVRFLAGLAHGMFMGAKPVFELLDHREVFEELPHEEREAVRTHVPFTRIFRPGKAQRGGEEIDLVAWARGNREQLVIKPSGGQEGRDVVLGWECTPSEWDDTIERTAGKPLDPEYPGSGFVVQERVPVGRSAFAFVGSKGDLQVGEHEHDYNPFVWNLDRSEGAFVRCHRGDGPLNVSRGAGVMPAWILEDA